MGAHSHVLLPHRRALVEDEIEMHLQWVTILIARLDRHDGDCDLEDDDPPGDHLDQGEPPTDNGAGLLPMAPVYGVDQTRGPINENSAYRAHRAAMSAE